MSKYDYDLYVIGAGSGGVRASRIAASLGARVAVAEDRYMGGTCVNVGCVPKKLYVYASQFSETFNEAAGFGWTLDRPQFDWSTLRDNKRQEIARLNGIYENLLEGAAVEIHPGRARITGPHSVVVNLPEGAREFSAERILIATGGWPHIPNFPGSEHAISSNEVFDLESFPQRLIVVGGGYIAVEFAGIFNGLGADTVQLYRRELFLRGFDQEVRGFVADEIRKKGVDLRFNSNIERIDKQSDGSLLATLLDGSQLVADTVLYATGRKPNLQGLGLETVNVALTDSGAVAVNDRFQTSEPSIYALGDVIGRMELTPVALAEGMALARHLYDGQPCQMDYDAIPTAVFCQPNIGTVGPSEEIAREQYGDIAVYTSSFRPLKNTISGSEERTLMKLIVDKASDRVIAAHMVGPDAGEIIQGIAIAIKAGATKAIFDSTIGIHPTAAEEFVTLREPVR